MRGYHGLESWGVNAAGAGGCVWAGSGSLPTTYYLPKDAGSAGGGVASSREAPSPSPKQEAGTTQAPAKLEPPGYWASNL